MCSYTEFYIQDRREQMSHVSKIMANYTTEISYNFVQLFHRTDQSDIYFYGLFFLIYQVMWNYE